MGAMSHRAEPPHLPTPAPLGPSQQPISHRCLEIPVLGPCPGCEVALSTQPAAVHMHRAAACGEQRREATTLTVPAASQGRACGAHISHRPVTCCTAAQHGQLGVLQHCCSSLVLVLGWPVAGQACQSCGSRGFWELWLVCWAADCVGLRLLTGADGCKVEGAASQDNNSRHSKRQGQCMAGQASG